MTIGDLLRREVDSLREFVVLLEQEREMLGQGATERLLPLIETKNSLAGALGTLAETRDGELARLGLGTGRAAMEAWLGRSGRAEERTAWENLLALAAQARELNVTNGKLIELHMRHNQQAFNALMGAADRAMTYGPDGQRHGGLGGRILGKA
jgi:flagella synthesis protein FlgN